MSIVPLIKHAFIFPIFLLLLRALRTRFPLPLGPLRLTKELSAQEIDVHNVIVNQLLFPNMITAESETSSQSSSKDARQPPTSCRMCLARHRIQTKYLEQIVELYEDMHVIQLPHLEEEVRGVASVQAFAQHLLKPFRR
ncbi:unnamed protein product [Echinostoma caproni]|uniref:ArsA_ATPase domain-containing protein n=1 Tax=Echinostoma caproni TaxID=27848 RepID=A0A183A4G3_9TREM|nr:unnamed protein product [Echinostoma caproni]